MTTVGVGALVCGVLVVGGASFTAGFLGSAGGELVADKIFLRVPDEFGYRR